MRLPQPLMPEKTCPKCGADTLAAGVVPRGGGSLRPIFIPDGLRRLRWRLGVPVREEFQACLSCGHLWSSVSAPELRSLFHKSGVNDAGIKPEGAPWDAL
jgi:hypothetical protein